MFDEASQFVIILLARFRNFIYRNSVYYGQLSPQGIGKQMLGEGLGKQILFSEHGILKSDNVFESMFTEQYTTSVNLQAGSILVSPAAQ